ncbi:hypothetical protein KTE60_30650 [Burkholderia multivorans]|uniref:hypothetical protein n=1 Tax=Burkholderia multivorans TaxID=87883 RepID=UPI001C224B89|nr:hypothetical protein [Burkholderia multivorans]MBU9633642.1 hypothetical protein [Burkholderia multivorans]MBU9633652.1 hypothetical protein [Burkholderia multivorans]
MKKAIFARVAAVGASVAALASNAQAVTTGPDYTSLTTNVDFTTTIAAVMAVAALVVGLNLAIRGAKTVIRMVGGR